jgi:hypothetical protein
MALTPQSIEYGKAEIDYSALTPLEGARQRAELSATVTYPAGHIAGTTVSVSMVSTGTNSGGIQMALALVEDNTDVNGDFTNVAETALSAGVLAYRDIGAADVVGGQTFVLGDGSGVAALNAALTKAGTMRLVVISGRTVSNCRRRAGVDTSAPSQQFHADSDGSEAYGGAVIGETITTKRDGWVGRRAKLPASGLTVSPADNQAYPDQPTITLNLDPSTSGTNFINSKQVRLAVTTDAAGSTVKKSVDVTPNSTGTITGTYNVDEVFAAASADHFLQVGINATLGNASTPAGQKPGLDGVATVNGLTASQRSWIIFDNSHDAAYTQVSESQVRDAGGLTIDPRLTCTHHFQTDDDVFGLSKDDNTNQMLATQSGFLWTIIKNARTEGVNSLSVTQTLDPVAAGTTITASDTTSTQDSQAGVSGRLDWTASKPGGTWNKTVDVTAPSDIDADTHLVNSTDVYTLLAVDPRVRVVVYLGQAGPGSSGRHLEPGDRLKATVTAFSTETRKRLTPDTGTVVLTLIRWSEAQDRFEYLQADGTTWAEWIGTTTAAVGITMADAGDGVTFITTLNATSGWGLNDIVAVNATLKISGTPYAEYTPREMTASNHRHDEAPNTGGSGDMASALLSRMSHGFGNLDKKFSEQVRTLETQVRQRAAVEKVDLAPLQTQIHRLETIVPKLQQLEVQIINLTPSDVMAEVIERQRVIEEDLDALLALTVRK